VLFLMEEWEDVKEFTEYRLFPQCQFEGRVSSVLVHSVVGGGPVGCPEGLRSLFEGCV